MRKKIASTDNHHKYLAKSRRPSKIGQLQSFLMSTFLYFLIAIAKNLFEEETLGTKCVPTQFGDPPNIP